MKPLTFAEACRKVETIVHCAGHTLSKVGNDYMHWQVNLSGAQKCYEGRCERWGQKRYFFSPPRSKQWVRWVAIV